MNQNNHSSLIDDKLRVITEVTLKTLHKNKEIREKLS